MAGTLTIDTLKASTGVLATQNGMTGIAKAWVNFAGATGTIAGSFNVSSVTRNTTGDYTINFTTAMANANYSASSLASNDAAAWTISSIISAATMTTTSCRMQAANLSSASRDPAVFVATFFGA